MGERIGVRPVEDKTKIQEQPEKEEPALNSDPRFSAFEGRALDLVNMEKTIRIYPPKLLEAKEITGSNLKTLLENPAGREQVLVTGMGLADKVDRYAKVVNTTGSADRIISDARSVQAQLSTINDALRQMSPASDPDLLVVLGHLFGQEETVLGLLQQYDPKASENNYAQRLASLRSSHVEEPVLEPLRIEFGDFGKLDPDIKALYDAEADLITQSHQLAEARKEEQASIVEETKSKMTFGTAAEELSKARLEAGKKVKTQNQKFEQAKPKVQQAMVKAIPRM